MHKGEFLDGVRTGSAQHLKEWKRRLQKTPDNSWQRLPAAKDSRSSTQLAT
jgi:hypothetical protein